MHNLITLPRLFPTQSKQFYAEDSNLFENF